MATDDPDQRKPRRTPTFSRDGQDDRIAYLRIHQGLSQADMARLTGIPERTYRRIENGKIFNPGIRHLANIARVLGIDPETHLANVCEPEWLEWQIFHKDSPKEPPPYEEYPDRFTNAEDY